MKFGELPVEEAVGAILAHKLYDNSGKLIFNKGHLLSEADLEALRGGVTFPVRNECETLGWNALATCLDVSAEAS